MDHNKITLEEGDGGIARILSTSTCVYEELDVALTPPKFV